MTLETRPVPKRVFFDIFERYEPAVLDASSRKPLKECPKKYFFKVVLGFKPNDASRNYPMFFGSCYHKFREVIEREWKENRANKVGDELFQHCLQIGLIVIEKMWKGDPGIGTKYDYLTKARLQKSCLLGWEHWKKEKIQGQVEILATEQPFDIYLKDGKTRSGGKLDSILRWISKPWVKDYKTTSINEERFKNLLMPNDQFSGYIHAGARLMQEDIYGVKVEVLFNTKKDGPTIYELTTTRTNTQLERWENNTIMIEEILGKYREADTWPEAEQHCVYCEFHMVCQQPTIAGQTAKLQSAFKQEPWDFKKSED